MLQPSSPQTITASQVNRNFGDITMGLMQGKTYVVERNGKEIGAFVPFYVYNNWERERKEFLNTISSIQKFCNMPEDKAMEIALKVVKEVRQEDKT